MVQPLYISRKKNVIADVLSRFDTDDTVKEEMFVFSEEPLTPFHIDRIKELQDTSEELKTLLADKHKAKHFKTKKIDD